MDLKTLVGSGPHGRITAEDVEKATGKVSTAPAPVITPPQPVSVPVAAPKAPIPASRPSSVALFPSPLCKKPSLRICRLAYRFPPSKWATLSPPTHWINSINS
ncbi:MAG UNVERIFIED_CONTAM: E3 binding domain-containing protein [Microcystis novacekii LVE1205-3]